VSTEQWPGQPILVRTDQRFGNTVEIVFAWIVTVLTGLYMLPWAIAATRGKANSLAVALVNFFLGWTVIGWIAALVMACTRHRPIGPAVQYVQPAPGWYTQPEGGQRYWNGAAWTEHTG
jgi:hypothetical protein